MKFSMNIMPLDRCRFTIVSLDFLLSVIPTQT